MGAGFVDRSLTTLLNGRVVTYDGSGMISLAEVARL